MGLLNNFNNIPSGNGINPLEILKAVKSGKMNDKVILNIIKQKNPQMYNEILSLTKGKNNNEIEQMVKAMCMQKNINFDEIEKLIK